MKTNFTGVWELNLAKSKLEMQPPDSSTLEIDHQEPKHHNIWIFDRH